MHWKRHFHDVGRVCRRRHHHFWNDNNNVLSDHLVWERISCVVFCNWLWFALKLNDFIASLKLIRTNKMRKRNRKWGVHVNYSLQAASLTIQWMVGGSLYCSCVYIELIGPYCHPQVWCTCGTTGCHTHRDSITVRHHAERPPVLQGDFTLWRRSVQNSLSTRVVVHFVPKKFWNEVSWN